MKRVPVTLFLALSTILLFVSSLLFPGKEPIPLTPVARALLFDDPKLYQLVDQLYAKYPEQLIEHPEGGPPELRARIREINSTSIWQGVFPWLLGQPLPQAALFSSIRQGEVWRLFTPVLLHENVLHIAFNLMWLVILAPLVEKKIGSLRFLFFVLLVAALSNLAQYLMSGSNFMGLSGVIAAVAGYLWMTKKRDSKAFRELPLAPLNFLLLFIFGGAFLQAMLFLYERSGGVAISLGIANTAHIAGAATGALLSFFRSYDYSSSSSSSDQSI